MSLTEKQLEMEINKGNVIQFLDGQEKKLFFGWVIQDTDFTDVAFRIQVIDEFGDPILIDGITWEGTITLGQVHEVVAESLDQFKSNDPHILAKLPDTEGNAHSCQTHPDEMCIKCLYTDDNKKKESKMIYGMEMNIHQIDEHTIQMYILDVKEGKRPHAPVTVEHPDKHPVRTKGNGEPYAREHGSLFNILKAQLIKQGKWIGGEK